MYITTVNTMTISASIGVTYIMSYYIYICICM